MPSSDTCKENREQLAAALADWFVDPPGQRVTEGARAVAVVASGASSEIAPAGGRALPASAVCCLSGAATSRQLNQVPNSRSHTIRLLP